MGVLDKFLDAIKLNDDYDDDGFLDDDLLEGEDDEDFLDDDFEDKPKKKFFDKFTKKKDSSEDEDFDDFDEKPLKSESKQTSSLKQPTASAAAKAPARQERAERQTRPAASSEITPMRSSRKASQGNQIWRCA